MLPLPACWPTSTWLKKQELYPWLKLTGNGGLLCNICQSSSTGISVDQPHFASQWITTGIFPNGCNKQAQLTSLRKKISEHLRSHSHKYAEKSVESAEKNVLPNMFLATSEKHLETTKRVFRCAYYLAKMNRSYSDMRSLVDLNACNGADLGVGLRSRMSAREIISVISKEMLSKLCQHVVCKRQKIAFMLDESVTNASKSVLILYIRTAWPDDPKSESAFAFPLDLIELNEITASHIATQVPTMTVFGRIW